jgi:hypothetical protein
MRRTEGKREKGRGDVDEEGPIFRSGVACFGKEDGISDGLVVSSSELGTKSE